MHKTAHPLSVFGRTPAYPRIIAAERWVVRSPSARGVAIGADSVSACVCTSTLRPEVTGPPSEPSRSSYCTSKTFSVRRLLWHGPEDRERLKGKGPTRGPSTFVRDSLTFLQPFDRGMVYDGQKGPRWPGLGGRRPEVRDAPEATPAPLPWVGWPGRGPRGWRRRRCGTPSRPPPERPRHGLRLCRVRVRRVRVSPLRFQGY